MQGLRCVCLALCTLLLAGCVQPRPLPTATPLAITTVTPTPPALAIPTLTPTPRITSTPLPATPSPTPLVSTYVDVHSHLHGKISATESDYEGAADAAVRAMDKWNIGKMLVMPPPFTNQASQQSARYEIGDMSGVLGKYPARFAFLGGGGELNPLIQKAVTGQGTVTVEEFKAKAREVAGITGFVGFGELATLHFCMGKGHVYEAADPDHELFRALVDIAAEVNVPIDIHQEAVPADMAFPALVTGGCAANPATISANIAKFKRLLSYARGKNVKIVWDHVGWDNTRQWTAALCDELLGEYDNLYMSIKVAPNDSPLDNRVVDESGNLKEEWLNLFEKYPNRFMLGSDQFFTSPKSTSRFPPSMDQTWAVLGQLPEDLRERIGRENARELFRLD